MNIMAGKAKVAEVMHKDPVRDGNNFRPTEIDKDYGVCGLGRTETGVVLPDLKKGPKLTPEEEEWANTAKSIFRKYANGDNFIHHDELSNLLGAISEGFSKSDVDHLLQDADLNKDGKIDFEEFVDWLMRPAAQSLGTAVVGYADCFKLLFDVYDKSGSGVILAQDFMECHCLMQAAFRMFKEEHDDNELQRSDPLDLKVDHEEVFGSIDKDGGGSISFLEFVDWMRNHIPKGIDRREVESFANNLAAELKDAFHHMELREEGYIDDNKLEEKIKALTKASTSLASGLKEIKRTAKPQWSEPPTGLSVDRLKSTHMAFRPLQFSRVREVHWECLCLPMPGDYEDPQTRLWVAEVIRRVFWKDSRKATTIEDAEYYVYDRKTFSWRNVSSDSTETFQDTLDHLSAGIALFCLLKTAANFGTKIAWKDIQLALEGGVDMKFIRQTDLEKYNKYMVDVAFETRKGEGLLDPEATRASQLKRSEEWLHETFQVKPRVVMATLSDLKIVEVDAAWEETEGVTAD